MSVSTFDIRITKTANSRIGEFNQANINFGKQYADHMLVAHYANGEWGTPEIVPFGHLSMSPATTFIHYGQSIFEGVKAYRNPEGQVQIFRPDANWRRMNKSAKRMAMPDIPKDLFLEGMRELIKIDSAWVPDGVGNSLYIRPFLFATDEFIGVRPAEKFTFMIITSPAGPYYADPVKIFVQDQFVRAFPGGIGATKAAGNYGASMYPTQEVKKMGYDQILWTDGVHHRFVQEIGTMNVFFVIGDTAVTPDLEAQTILEGVTRDSIITLLREKGMKVEERPIAIDELEDAFKKGELKEAFGAGTAASIAPIAELTFHEDHMVMPALDTWETTNWLKKELQDIRYGLKPDTHNWMFSV